MQNAIGQGIEGQSQLVTLEPVPVNRRNLGRVMGAFRKADIYFQFGERRGNQVYLYVLPFDYDDAFRIATMAAIPRGCILRWLMLVLALGALVAGASMFLMIGV
jgi:hypothetical protein